MSILINDNLLKRHLKLDYLNPGSLNQISLITLLIKEDINLKIWDNLTLNHFFSLIVKVSFIKANSLKLFKPRHYKEAITDSDNDK